MLLNRFKKRGQSAVELFLIAVLVVGVSWSGLQLVNSKMSQGLSAFAGQYRGNGITISAITAPVPTGMNNVPSSVPPQPTSGNTPSKGTGNSSGTTGSGSVALPPASGVVAPPSLTTSPQTPSPMTITGTNGAIVSSIPVTPSFTTTSASNTPVKTVSNAPVNALPAAGDGCMGCAASMTTDLGW